MTWLLDLLGAIPYPLLRAFGQLLGWLGWVSHVRRGVVLENLRLAFPEKTPEERREIARGMYRHLGQMMPDFLRVPSMSREELDRLFVYQGWERFEAAHALGKGVIACTAHFGNFDLLAAANTRRGVPITMISREMGKNPVNALWRAARIRSGVEDLVVKKGSTMRAALRALQGGRVLGYVFDQHQPGRCVRPIFFGVPAATASTPAYLARKTGAAVIFTVSVPLGDGRHQLVIEGPFELPDTGNPEADDLAFMQALTDRLEHWIRLHPDRWWWLHKRWKVKPSEWPADAPRRPEDVPPIGVGR